MKIINADAQVLSKIPNLVLFVGKANINNPNEEQISAYLKTSWEKLAAEITLAQPNKHPRLEMMLAAIKNAGISTSKYPPSIESVFKRVEKKDEPFKVNPIVDVFTGITCELGVSFGAYDNDKIDGQISLRLSPGNEEFLAINSTETELTDEDEIVYADENDVLERNFVWKQADKGKISQDTTQIVFFCELFTEMGMEAIDEARQTIENRLKTLLNASELESELISN
jgi:DNA/RNA-binding domain of Phe-tRNA-synthetase-like protein